MLCVKTMLLYRIFRHNHCSFSSKLPFMFSKFLYLLLFGLVFISCKDERSIQGDTHFQSGDYDKALQSYNEYLGLKPDHIKTIYNRGRTYEAMGNNEKALDDYTKVLKLDPTNQNALLSVGQFYQKRNELTTAEFYFKKVIEINQKNALGHFYLGMVLQQQGKIRDAIEAYTMAVSQDKNLSDAYLYRGTARISNNQKSLSCDDFKKAKNLGNKEADAMIQRHCR
jgi:tetratricopeptide (TPR) repeat protein